MALIEGANCGRVCSYRYICKATRSTLSASKVKRVFVMGDCDQVIPSYLRFVKGVVDAEDMSLNVSREILQQDRRLTAIRRRLTKKVLSTIKSLQSERPQDYATLWTQFGAVLKEGLMSDLDNQDTLLRISSFASTHNDDELTTLADYGERRMTVRSRSSTPPGSRASNF